MDQKTQDRIVEAVLTCATCGEGCWYAREVMCRCSCGGKNHGCLLDGGTERPARTSKIDGVLYTLIAVGSYPDLYRESREILKVTGPKDVHHGYKFYWSATEAGSPVRLKAVSKAQLAGWAELKNAPPMAYLLWRRLENNPKINVS